MKSQPDTLARIIQAGIRQLYENRAQRQKLGISLYDLQQADRDRRALLRQARKQRTEQVTVL